MANKSDRRIKGRAQRKAAKARSMKHGGHKSNYARKHEFLLAHGGFGFEYSEPKPWK